MVLSACQYTTVVYEAIFSRNFFGNNSKWGSIQVIVRWRRKWSRYLPQRNFFLQFPGYKGRMFQSGGMILMAFINVIVNIHGRDVNARGKTFD